MIHNTMREMGCHTIISEKNYARMWPQEQDTIRSLMRGALLREDVAEPSIRIDGPTFYPHTTTLDDGTVLEPHYQLYATGWASG